MPEYQFYYDETEHSRKINYNTVSASNYYDNFVTMIVGWPSAYDEFLMKYIDFEAKYSGRKDRNGEIKSTTLSQKQFQYGFASLNKQNTKFVNDFLELFDSKICIYFSVESKIEYLILQLFNSYHNNSCIDADLLKYSITKALVVYRPNEIIKALYESPESFLKQLKIFLRHRIKCNKSNLELKKAETKAFQDALIILDEISDAPRLDWDYHMSFMGFKKYLQEKNIQNYRLTIDKEGNDGVESKTLIAAQEVGLNNLEESHSTDCPGLRIADMLAGIIAKLMKALCDALHYQSLDESLHKKILTVGWFRLNNDKLRLYKKLYQIICVWQPAWYKAFSGIYSDDLIILNAFLNFMNHFESTKEISGSIDLQGEYFNAFACEQLSKYFNRRKCKLPVEPINPYNEEAYLNQRGGKVFFDSSRQCVLPIHEGSQKFEVLSVGIAENCIPMVTILLKGKPECFQLPKEFLEWAFCVVDAATVGEKMFPAKVCFTKVEERYYADIL